MIYMTGDCHQNYRKFTKRRREELPFEMTENDYVIVCGDFGLLWAKDETLKYNCDWLARLPFKILFVDGNHENFAMLDEYPVEEWHGGKVRHIVRDRIIHLMRGQVFEIDGSTLFTFGGASSHDIQGGVLDKNDPDYNQKRKKAIRSGLPYRVLNISWWKEELPTEDELQEGRNNLEKVGYKVDYVISHCASNRTQYALERIFSRRMPFIQLYKQDILTTFFDELEDKLQYKHWFCGHYHEDMQIDGKHSVLYHSIRPLSDFAQVGSAFEEDFD